jgi:hypothetical protein
MTPIEAGRTIGISVTREWMEKAHSFIVGHVPLDGDVYRFTAKLFEMDARGVWVDFTGETGNEYRLLVPWQHIYTVIESKNFSAKHPGEERKMGFQAIKSGENPTA